jgi:vacuolar-type H+-ATPase subunit C/Vma6
MLEALNTDINERIRNIVQMYGDRPTVLYALRSLNWKTDHDLMMATGFPKNILIGHLLSSGARRFWRIWNRRKS